MPATHPTPRYTVFTQRLVSDHVYEGNIAINSYHRLVDRKIKIPAWYCYEDEAVMLFDLYFTFESKLGWHGGIDEGNSNTSCSVLIVGRNGRMRMVSLMNNFKFCRLNWKLSSFELLSYVFLTVLDPPAWFISVTHHVDKSLKMAAKLGDCRKLGKFTEW